jgi:hypothetical protein
MPDSETVQASIPLRSDVYALKKYLQAVKK